MKISNLKIGVRLGGGFGLVLLMMVSLIAIALGELTNIGKITHVMVNEDWVKIEAMNAIDTTTRTNARYSLELFVAPDKAYADSVRQKIGGNKKIITDALATLDQLVRRPDGKAMLAKLKQDREAYVASFTKVDQLLADEKRDEATKVMLNETLPALNTLRQSVSQLADLQTKVVRDSGASVAHDIDFSRNLMFAIGLAAVALGVACAYALTRSVTRPVGEALSLAQMVAAGDLTGRIEVTSTDETGQLLQALKDMNDNLLKMVGQVRAGTDAIATASNQIAAGNLDLSARTEEQASSLEETAASMEELTSTVKQNAANAVQAKQLAVAASDVAAEGGAIVSQVVDTMEKINESSRKITDIIGVIDSIAFQTNILALNAAVEAARAGEQGRGFAVVATEVRNLAQRSAAAAKDIKTLIGESVAQVDAGTKLVDQAGATMGNVVSSVKHVTDIMTEISAASQEQTAGIEQVNQAVTQMDEVTQQNAALVEEAAGAAQSMKEQADNLADMVGMFKLAA